MSEGQNENKIVTRFAPSPTGFLHVGNIRTAIFAFLWAKRNNGTFILRIEDTDKDREVAGAIERLKEALVWLGINWDEGPDIGGPHAPYIQSERLPLYKKYALELLERGLAYPDPFTEDEVELLRAKAEQEKKPFLYREYRNEATESWDGTKPLRFKVPNIKPSKWQDVVFGELSAGEEALDDFILIKADGFPTYNFAHIVDDIEMGVTHVMRGSEFIASTPKFLSVYEALDKKPPVFVSLPHIMAEGGKKKLSKRDGAKDLLEYRNEGYLPDAMVNFLALMGWNPGTEQEIFSREALIQAFDITKIQKSGAQLNEEKLAWINKEHIKMLDLNQKFELISPYLPIGLKHPKIVELISERITKIRDTEALVESGEFDFFIKAPEYAKEKLLFKETDPKQISANIEEAINILKGIEEKDFHFENIKSTLMKLADSRRSRGEVLHPIRFALCGMDKSPDPFIIAEILGKDETIIRLNKAV